MSAQKWSYERFVRVYSDSDGYYWEIRPDSDGLGCVEIVYSENRLGEEDRKHLTTIPPDAARLVAQAIMEIAKQISDE